MEEPSRELILKDLKQEVGRENMGRKKAVCERTAGLKAGLRRAFDGFERKAALEETEAQVVRVESPCGHQRLPFAEGDLF